HTFALRPSIGAYRAAAAQVSGVAPLPPVSGLTCTAGTNNWRITLGWTAGWTYDAVTIVRDGVQITSLAGTASSYNDNLAGPGVYAYQVYGMLAGQASLGAACSAEIVYVPPVTLTLCQIGQDRVARLTWTNGASTYDRIDILLDGAAVPESPLPGTTTAYTSAPLAPGVHTLAVRPAIGTYLAAPRECTGTAIVPAPTNLACTLPAESWRVALSWTNTWDYEGITITRNGAAIAALDGTATAHVDVAPALGSYTYQVLGVFGGQSSAPASCTLSVTVVPPVTLTLCEIDEERAAHLAWTLGDAVYDGIEVLIDAALAATLPGTATSYDSAVLAPGAHAFAIRPFAGATRAADAACSAEAPPPPPAGLQCSLRPTLWTVNLSWTNPLAYDQVRILRNDEEIFAGTGATTSYTDHAPRPGAYSYQVLGCLGSRCSDPATCAIELTEVPPVSIGQCDIGSDRVLQLAWSNGIESYDGIALLIDGLPAPESPLPGTAASYASAPLVPGTHTFALRPFIGAYQAEPATCSAAVVLPMPAAFTCATIGESWDVNLTWTNGWQYGSVTILRDGMPVAVITGAPTNYVDTVFAVGVYEYSIYGSFGVLNSETATCTAEITLVPPVEITRCEVDAQSTAHLSWSSTIEAYDGIEIQIDGVLTADSPLPGTTVSYTSAPLGPGGHTFTIQAFIGTHRSEPVSCESFAPPPPPAGLLCAASNSNMQVALTWTNGWAYDSIAVYRNSITIATLPGAEEAYTDTVDANGSYAYIVAGVLGDKEAQSEGCIVRVTYVPKPEQLTCHSVGTAAELAWVNPIAYDEIEVLRDGATVGIYAGDTQSIQDALPDEAPHQYCVIGRLGRYASDCASCMVQAGGIRPFIRGDVNADGIVNIADPIFLLGYLFRSERPPPCLESANLNNDTKLDIADAIWALGYLFREEKPPMPPFPECGVDIEGGNYLGCEIYTTCP
ncbi:MAG TPA: hypothetical protein DCM87_17610, partial [Planctomycetes bacterium]|nr:hypothetical protein [Planctomycetota bacterium]